MQGQSTFMRGVRDKHHWVGAGTSFLSMNYFFRDAIGKRQGSILWHRKETNGHASPRSGSPDRRSANVLKPASFCGDSLLCASSVNNCCCRSEHMGRGCIRNSHATVILQEIEQELPETLQHCLSGSAGQSPWHWRSGHWGAKATPNIMWQTHRKKFLEEG